MKILIFCFCLGILGTLPCYARLGETIDECHQRYGSPQANGTQESGKAKLEVFFVGAFRIIVIYWDQSSVQINYTKMASEADGAPIGKMSMDETLAILNDKEANNQHWGKATVIRLNMPDMNANLISHEYTTWIRSDGVVALLDETPDRNDLTLKYGDSTNYDLAEAALNAAYPKTSTKGL